MSLIEKGNQQERLNNTTESPEAVEIKEQMRRLEAERKKIDLELHRLQERLKHVQERKEQVYADFEQPLELPKEWHLTTEDAFDPYEQAEDLPPGFTKMVQRLREYKNDPKTRAVLKDIEEMTEGRMNQRSYSDPDKTLLQIYQDRYKGWKISDLAELLNALPENTTITKVQSFDQLANAAEGVIDRVRGGGWDYFSPDMTVSKMNQALVTLARSQMNHISPDLKTALEEAVYNNDLPEYLPETQWFSYDERNKEILFEGETIANYTTGEGGKIETIDKSALKSALEKFLRKNLPFLPRKQEE